jgi:hypothetical protein
MAHDYETIEEIMQEDFDRGCFDIYCEECGDERTVEPDGWFICECGTRHESPMLELGVI